MRLTGTKNMIGIRRRQMRKESKWVYAVLFVAVLLLAAGNSSTVYAKSNTSKTVSISAKELSLTKGQSAALSVKNNRKKVKWASSEWH